MLNSKKIYLLALFGLLITACGGATPNANTKADIPTADPDLGYEIVSFTTSDDRKLGGRIYPGGENAVILAHMLGTGANQRNWSFFAETLAAKGYTVLTFDFRGMGTSQKTPTREINLVYLDSVAAVNYLEVQGFEKIVCIGGSMGGAACLRAGLEVDIAGVVSLSAPMSMGAPTELTEENLPMLSERKLFVVAENDGSFALDAKRMYDLSPEPKEIQVYTGSAHGINLLKSPHKDELEQLIFDFLAEM
ncbi:MAG: alpha/beta hydrolase [Chloroflexota bacterium]